MSDAKFSITNINLMRNIGWYTVKNTESGETFTVTDYGNDLLSNSSKGTVDEVLKGTGKYPSTVSMSDNEAKAVIGYVRQEVGHGLITKSLDHAKSLLTTHRKDIDKNGALELNTQESTQRVQVYNTGGPCGPLGAAHYADAVEYTYNDPTHGAFYLKVDFDHSWKSTATPGAKETPQGLVELKDLIQPFQPFYQAPTDGEKVEEGCETK